MENPIKPNTQVKVLSKEHSEHVQKLAFKDGFKWGSSGVKFIDIPVGEYIGFYNNLEMMFGEKRSVDEIFIDIPTSQKEPAAKFNHYFKDVSDIDEVDVYRVCDLFEINDSSGAMHHAIKKLLCAGKRGAKDYRKDLEEARDSINRKLQMMSEDRE